MTDAEIVAAIEKHTGWFVMGQWLCERVELPHVEMEGDVMLVSQALQVARAALAERES